MDDHQVTGHYMTKILRPIRQGDSLRDFSSREKDDQKDVQDPAKTPKKPDEMARVGRVKGALVHQLQGMGGEELAQLARLLPSKEGQLDAKPGTQLDAPGTEMAPSDESPAVKALQEDGGLFS